MEIRGSKTNALVVFRGEDSGRVVPAVGDLAPRLAELRDALDRAVCDAYGWEYDVIKVSLIN